jgi:3-isopropylmalate dehydrogenase
MSPSEPSAPPSPHSNGVPLFQKIGVVLGEGIGPSIIEQALIVLRAAIDISGAPIEIEFAPDRMWNNRQQLDLNDEFGQFYSRCFADQIPILHGPAGGRFVYELRATFALDVKLTPITPHPDLADASLLRPERVRAADVMLIRDNSGGLYQGDFGWRDNGTVAYQETSYRRQQVQRVMAVALQTASQRDNRLTVVTKPGGLPTISALWKDTAEQLNVSGVELSYMEVDNACFQLGSAPQQFDVIVAPNMFGDVLGDTAAIALGSRGMSYSANFSGSGAAVYQTAHGAAHDLADRNVANPVGQLLTLCWLLRRSLQRDDLALSLERSIAHVLRAGYRTADIAGPDSSVVSTSELGARIAAAVSAQTVPAR